MTHNPPLLSLTNSRNMSTLWVHLWKENRLFPVLKRNTGLETLCSGIVSMEVCFKWGCFVGMSPENRPDRIHVGRDGLDKPRLTTWGSLGLCLVSLLRVFLDNNFIHSHNLLLSILSSSWGLVYTNSLFSLESSSFNSVQCGPEIFYCFNIFMLSDNSCKSKYSSIESFLVFSSKSWKCICAVQSFFSCLFFDISHMKSLEVEEGCAVMQQVLKAPA